MTAPYTRYAVAAGLCFLAGLAVGYWAAPTPEQPVAPIPTTATVERQTVVKYIPKESPKDADLDINTGKQDMVIRVNGKEQTFQKASDERFIFDKNKIMLDQQQTATLDIRLPDATRHWSIGIGASKHGTAGMVKFPIKRHIGGWVAGNRRDIMGGVCFNF